MQRVDRTWGGAANNKYSVWCGWLRRVESLGTPLTGPGHQLRSEYDRAYEGSWLAFESMKGGGRGSHIVPVAAIFTSLAAGGLQIYI